MVIDDTMPSVIGFLDKNIRISVDKTPIVDPEVGINASIRIVNQQSVWILVWTSLTEDYVCLQIIK